MKRFQSAPAEISSCINSILQIPKNVMSASYIFFKDNRITQDKIIFLSFTSPKWILSLGQGKSNKK